MTEPLENLTTCADCGKAIDLNNPNETAYQCPTFAICQECYLTEKENFMNSLKICEGCNAMKFNCICV